MCIVFFGIVSDLGGVVVRNHYAFQQLYAQFRCCLNVDNLTLCARAHIHKPDRIAWLLGLMCAHDWGLCSLTVFFHLYVPSLTSLFLSLGPKLILCVSVCVFFCLFISHIIRFLCRVAFILLTVRNYNENFCVCVSYLRLLAVVTVATVIIIFCFSPSYHKFVKIQILIDWRKLSVFIFLVYRD